MQVWGDQMCGAMSMSAFQVRGAGNNDHLYNNRNARSIAVVENSDSRLMCEEIFKQVTGEDSMSLQAKYKGGITCVFAGKLTFFLNSQPKWSTHDADAIRRRYPYGWL